MNHETRSGIAVAEAAKAAGAAHLVYSSVGGAERGTGIPHFESKYLVEQHIREAGLHATILRPVAKRAQSSSATTSSLRRTFARPSGASRPAVYVKKPSKFQNGSPETRKPPRQECREGLSFLVAGAGFEPATFGL